MRATFPTLPTITLSGAAAAGLSVPHFSRFFRRQTGRAPVDYLIRQRIRDACRLLDTADAAVAAIAAEVGYRVRITSAAPSGA